MSSLKSHVETLCQTFIEQFDLESLYPLLDSLERIKGDMEAVQEEAENKAKLQEVASQFPEFREKILKFECWKDERDHDDDYIHEEECYDYEGTTLTFKTTMLSRSGHSHTRTYLNDEQLNGAYERFIQIVGIPEEVMSCIQDTLNN